MTKSAPLEITVVKSHWLRRGLQLLQQNKVVGKIEYTGRIRMDSTATLLDERWKITQFGFWRTNLEFRGSDSPFSKVRITPSFRGKLEWTGSDGKAYVFRKIKWWKNTWAWYDENQDVMIEIRPDHTFSNKQAHVTIYNITIPDYRLLTLIGIYIFKIQKAHAAAAAT